MARMSLADARTWQILSLGLLLTYGVAVLGFDQAPANIALIIASALATQWLCERTISDAPFDPLVMPAALAHRRTGGRQSTISVLRRGRLRGPPE